MQPTTELKWYEGWFHAGMEWSDWLLLAALGVITAYCIFCIIYYLAMGAISTCAYLRDICQRGRRRAIYNFIDPLGGVLLGPFLFIAALTTLPIGIYLWFSLAVGLVGGFIAVILSLFR